MNQTPQETQPLQQTPDRKQYHAPEFRDYGTVQELTQTSQVILSQRDGAVVAPGYMTGAPT